MIFRTEKKYNIIYADPPWKYDRKVGQGVAEGHYHTMDIEDICSLPVRRIAANDESVFFCKDIFFHVQYYSVKSVKLVYCRYES